MGFLKYLFKVEKSRELLDYSGIGVDVHSHLIPAIDDGVQSIDEAFEAIRGLKKAGFNKLITTPHIMVDRFYNTKDSIIEGCNNLRKELKREQIDIEIKAAAEYHVDFLLSRNDNFSDLLTMRDNHLLFELSYYLQPPDLETLLFKLQIGGYKLILAHPERYFYFHNNFSAYENLKNRNVYFQLNINSLSGYYTQAVKKVAEKLLKSGMIDFLGTDTHSPAHVDALSKSLSNKNLVDFIAKGQVKNKLLW